MHRLVSLLLVSLQLACLGVCPGHSHAATGVAEPEGHAARPHVHLHSHAGKHRHHHHGKGGHSHRHEADDERARLNSTADHDADAVDVTDGTVTRTQVRLTPIDLSSKLFAGGVLLPLQVGIQAGSCSVAGVDDVLAVAAARCPLYLRTLSVRC